MRLIIFYTLMVCSWYSYSGSYWHPKWTILLSVLAVFISAFISTRSHWSVGLMFLYSIISGLYVVTVPGNHFQNYNLITDMIIERNSCFSILSIILVAWVYSIAKFRELRFIGSALSWLCVIDSLVVIYEWLSGMPAFERGGLFGNASLNGCLIAALFPLYAFDDASDSEFRKQVMKENWKIFIYGFTIFIPMFAVALSGSSMAFGVLFVVLLTHGIQNLKLDFTKKAYFCFASILIFIGFGLLSLGGDFFDTSGRINTVTTGFDWLIQNDKWILGYGQGTTQLILPVLIKKVMVHERMGYILYSYFFHSDWFQIFFELGAVGLALALNVVYFAIRRSLGRPWLVTAIVGYCAFMLGNFPVHISIPAFLGGFLIMAAHKGV